MSVLSSLQGPFEVTSKQLTLKTRRDACTASYRVSFLINQLEVKLDVLGNHKEIFQHQIAGYSKQLLHACQTAKLKNKICKFSLRIPQNENRFVYLLSI